MFAFTGSRASFRGDVNFYGKSVSDECYICVCACVVGVCCVMCTCARVCVRVRVCTCVCTTIGGDRKIDKKTDFWGY